MFLGNMQTSANRQGLQYLLNEVLESLRHRALDFVSAPSATAPTNRAKLPWKMRVSKTFALILSVPPSAVMFQQKAQDLDRAPGATNHN
jgi:hypothetical protein